MGAEMIPSSICKHSAGKIASTVRLLDQRQWFRGYNLIRHMKGGKHGMSRFAIPYRSVSWIQANLMWEGGMDG